MKQKNILNNRILLLPTDTGGHCWGIKSGLEANSINADVIYFLKSKFGFPYTFYINLEGKNKLIKQIIKLKIFLGFLKKYDIFHYCNANSLLPFKIDLFILKLFKKKIFVTFNGTSTRLKNESIKNYKINQFAIDGIETGANSYLSDKKKKKTIEIWKKMADQIFCLNPDLCRFVENAKFLPYIRHIMLQKNKSKFTFNKNKIRICHAPTSREAKGTKYFLEAVDKLKQEYSNIELVLIENVKNSEVIEIIKSCTLMFDQCLVGWYGGVALEAMSFGIPVMAYIRNEDLVYLPKEMKENIPIINCTPFSIYDELKKILESPEVLKQYSKDTMKYVSKYHDPKVIAESLIKTYLK